MSWNRVEIETQTGETLEAIAPLVLTASRATDIPAFFDRWFFEKLDIGYLRWINPFNGKTQFVSLENTRFVVFWTKHPDPRFVRRLPELEKRGIGFYFQYTLNDYEDEGLEPGLPSLVKRLEAFKSLAAEIGREHVVWRFDPLVLFEGISVEKLLDKMERLAEILHEHTEKLVFSFADIDRYRKVRRNLARLKVQHQPWAPGRRHQLADKLARLNERWGLDLATCCENDDLIRWNIHQNSCVDPELIGRLAPEDKQLKSIYSVRSNLKDKGQRTDCLCALAKDIGRYDTCRFGCVYCYANSGLVGK